MFGAEPWVNLVSMVEVAQIAEYMAGESAPPQRVLARIAARQHGVVSRAQLDALDLDDQFAARWMDCGRLHQIHRGVYAVGHASLTARARWMAAVLAGGEGALLSHLTAAVLWGILEWASPITHVVVAGPSGHRRPGLAMHRTRNLPPDHRWEIDGIPVTSLHRTLLDCASMLSAGRLRFAIEAADRGNEQFDIPALVALCDASRGKRGAGTLRRLALEQRGTVDRTKSPPEARFLRACRRRGLPEPHANHRVGGYEVDFHWPDAKLVVEIDSYAFHRSWAQRQRDLERDAALQVRGYDVLRVTPERLKRDEDGVFGQVAALLA